MATHSWIILCGLSQDHLYTSTQNSSHKKSNTSVELQPREILTSCQPEPTCDWLISPDQLNWSITSFIHQWYQHFACFKTTTMQWFNCWLHCVKNRAFDKRLGFRQKCVHTCTHSVYDNYLSSITLLLHSFAEQENAERSSDWPTI